MTQQPIRELLAEAAAIIDADAEALRKAHTLTSGAWPLDDESDVAAHAEYHAMIRVRDQLLALTESNVEWIRWQPASQPPDDDTTVMTFTPEGACDDEVWPGYLDADGWFTPEGVPLHGVTHWAEMPTCPSQEE